MARIRWHGAEYTAEPIRQLPNGNWLMRAKQHGPRFAVGSEIEVKRSEVIEMAAAELPPDDAVVTEEDKSRLTMVQLTHSLELEAIERGMAEERKALPPPQQLIAKAPKTVREPEPGED